MTLNLSLPGHEELKPRITVFGVGGAGGNAVNNMIEKQLEGVEFVVANTDAQALQQSMSVAAVSPEGQQPSPLAQLAAGLFDQTVQSAFQGDLVVGIVVEFVIRNYSGWLLSHRQHRGRIDAAYCFIQKPGAGAECYL